MMIHVGQITDFDGVLVTPLRLVEHGTQHHIIGSIWSTSVSSTNRDGETRTPSTSVICPNYHFCQRSVHK